MPLQMGLIRNHYVGPHVHRAASVDPALRRAREAQPGARASCRAGASCSSTTRSCAARRAARSSRWCARPARARCTCGSAVRRRSRRASTASTRRGASELIAATHSLEEIRRYIGADSLGYLSLDGLLVGGRADAVVVLHVVLHRRLSGRVSAQRGRVPAARAETDRIATVRSPLVVSPSPLAVECRAGAGAQAAPPAAPTDRRRVDRRNSASFDFADAHEAPRSSSAARRPRPLRRCSSAAVAYAHGRVRPLSRAGAAGRRSTDRGGRAARCETHGRPQRPPADRGVSVVRASSGSGRAAGADRGARQGSVGVRAAGADARAGGAGRRRARARRARAARHARRGLFPRRR